MKKQLVITVGREYGSGGHAIAEMLAKDYEISFYDRSLVKELAKDKNLDAEKLTRFDENPKNKLFSRTVNGLNSSPQEAIAQMQFKYLKEKVEAGESFVIVGRCAESVLKDYPNVVSIFVLGDMDKKIERIARLQNSDEKEAEEVIRQMDKKRKNYHNSYSEIKWGDARGYDLTINSSKLGLAETKEVIEKYINERYERMK